MEYLMSTCVLCFFSSRRRHTRCALVTEFRRVLFRSLAIAERRMGRRLFNGPTADNPSGKRRRVVRELDDALKQDLLDWVDGGDEEGRIAMLDLDRQRGG